MFKSVFLKNTIITAIILGFQFPIFAQAINNDIEVKAENLPVVLPEEVKTSVIKRQTVPISLNSAQLYFTIDSGNSVIEENDFSRTILEEINRQRLVNSLPVLTLNSKLNKAAELKVTDMVKNGYFDHNSPTGLTPWCWFDEVGYDFIYAGENLAVDFDSPEGIVQAWMDSPSHRQNILDNHFNETGLAVMQGEHNGHSSLFVVQMFGQPRIRVNDFVNADIMVDSEKQSMNLVHAVVHYPSDKLILNAINFDNSDFSLFLKEVDVEKGTIIILAIQPFPGIKGIAEVAHLEFKTLEEGDVDLTWGDDSVVLANDGLGTNILSDTIDISYCIE